MPGRLLDPAEWPFPASDVIPFPEYHQARELRGKPTDDLSFDVARGCPVGCVWCIDPLKGGRKDRRRSGNKHGFLLRGLVRCVACAPR